MTAVIFLLMAASGDLDRLTQSIAASGCILQLAVPRSERLAPPEKIAPGALPLLSFRFFEGMERHRFGNLDLVLDDASH